jgi:hypothetical protein
MKAIYLSLKSEKVKWSAPGQDQGKTRRNLSKKRRHLLYDPEEQREKMVKKDERWFFIRYFPSFTPS